MNLPPAQATALGAPHPETDEAADGRRCTKAVTLDIYAAGLPRLSNAALYCLLRRISCAVNERYEIE